MKKLKITTILCGLILFITACGPSGNKIENSSTASPSINEGEVTIGNQVWTTKNLDVAKYRNGDSISEEKDNTAWAKLTTGAWCYYENNTANGTKYGKLYNWYAVNDPRGLAPNGYHIPTDADWTKLTDNLGDEAGTKMKSTSGWKNNGNETNSSGFAGLPGGCSFRIWGFNGISSDGLWWSSSESNTNDAWNRHLSDYDGNVYGEASNKQAGFSVRCIKD